VLVIGAGPSGLFAAAELERHGVRARDVDDSPSAPRGKPRNCPASSATASRPSSAVDVVVTSLLAIARTLPAR
jgi:cation diffusion facilitator CzcD-associated flavoprotein CzcO